MDRNKKKKLSAIFILFLAFLIFSAKGLYILASNTVQITATVDSTSFPQPTISISALPDNITLGQSTTISWTASQNADSISFSPPTLGCAPILNTIGSCTIIPLQTTTYSINVLNSGSGLMATSSVLVTVNSPPSAPTQLVPPLSISPTVDIKANASQGPITVPFNGSVKLSWTSMDAQSCSAGGDWSGSKALFGEETISNLQSSKLFTITCFKDNLFSSDSVSVNVQPEEPIIIEKQKEEIKNETQPNTGIPSSGGGQNAQTETVVYFTVIADKNSAQDNGNDKIEVTVTALDKNGKPIPSMEVSILGTTGDNIYPLKNITNTEGKTVFQVSSSIPHKVQIQASPTVPVQYSSQKLNIEFLGTPLLIDEGKTQKPNPTVIDNIISSILNFRQNDDVKNIADGIIAPIAGVMGAILAYFFIASLLSSITDLLPLLNYLINFLLQLIGIRKKPKQYWGIIYDSSNKLPIDLAIVRLIDANTNQIVETAVTDKIGRFLLSPETGNYYIKVSKRSFMFPSKNLEDLTIDGVYSNLYFGESINIENKNIATNFSIPIDPIYRTNKNILDYIRNAIYSTLDKMSAPALMLGIIVSLLILWISPMLINALITALYIGLVFMKKILLAPSPRPIGEVVNIDTGKPISNLNIKIFDSKYNKLLDTKKTDESGRFSILLPDGSYYFRIASYNYDFAKKGDFYNGEIIEVDNSKRLSIKIGLKNLSANKAR